MKRGLLLVAHGARDPRWSAPFEAVAAHVVAAAPEAAVQLSFLEWMTPRTVDGGTSLTLQQCTHIDVVPLFLGSGGHVRHDLPALVQQLREQHPEVTWTLKPPIGEQELVINAMAQAAVQA